MCLLRVLRRILSCGQDDEEQPFDYRNYGNYSSISSSILPSRSNFPHRSKTTMDSPQRHHDWADKRALLSPARPVMGSRDNLKPPSVISHPYGDRTIFSAAGSSDKPAAGTPFSFLSTPSFNSSVCAPSIPAPSSKPSFTRVCDTTINIPVARVSIGPEKPQITNDSSRRSLDKQNAKSLQPKSQPPSISSCTATAPSSKNPSLVAISSTNSISTVGSPVSPAKLQISPGPATRSPSSPSPQNKDSVSHAPPLKPSTPPTSVANSSFYGDGGRIWRKKLASTESSRETKQNIRSLSQISVKVTTPNSSSSETTSPLSEASSFSSPLEPQISKRRVLPKYQIPKNLEEMIKKDIVPPVLNCPLSPSTYVDYFATLLYAEDFYLEKWSEYLLKDVMLELRPRMEFANSRATNMKMIDTMADPEDFVTFKIVSVPEKRPYLLSRDFVFLKPPNAISGPFKGILFRVVKGVILVEFGDDFHSQHSPSKTYDVSFSFNRVCLKRAHQAISVATDPSFRSILFPDQSSSPQPNPYHLHERVFEVQDPVKKIANHKGPIPYLVEGELSVSKERNFHRHKGRIYDEEIRPSATGNVILNAILNIYRANPCCRILLCSPTNNTSDELLRSLRNLIPKARFFRANAAFRDYDLVPDDIVSASLYEEDEYCFACPPLAELLNFNVITSTFISSFRLYSAGIETGHFSHIFLVDACLVIEPEAIVPLANLAGNNTAIVVTGCATHSPGWVRSEIARKHGLKMSYFSRLLRHKPYSSGDRMFIAKIQ